MLCLLLARIALPASAQGVDRFILYAQASAQTSGANATTEPATLVDALRAIHDPFRDVQSIDAVVLAAQTTADVGKHAGDLHSHGIHRWARSGNPDSNLGVLVRSDADTECQAAVCLRQRGSDISYSALTEAVGNGQPRIVSALLTAGLNVSGTDAYRAMVAVVSGLANACNASLVPTVGVAESLAVLVGRGLSPNLNDASGNTMLMAAAQFCPAAITSQLLALGAAVDPVNKQGFTPLQMALVSGKWEVAKVLIDQGARITRTQADQIFFEPPQDQTQRDLIARATR